MRVFNILLNNQVSSLNLEFPFQIDEIQVSEKSKDLDVDNKYMNSLYGFPMSTLEVNLFSTHINIWKELAALEEEVCLVIENITKINVDLNKILNRINDLPSDWDIFFPYDREINDGNLLKGDYLLGHRWGTDAYFVNKLGADKLLNKCKIRQPLDDEILSLVNDQKLNLYCENTGFFDYGTQETYYKERNLHKNKFIFNSNAWTDSTKLKIKTLLKRLSKIAEQHNIKLILSDGSLLGQIRHRGIMPWDDDVDLAIEEDEVNLLLLALSKERTLKCVKRLYDGTLYYKIWGLDGEKIPGYEYTFPFIDIWPFVKDNRKVVFKHGTQYPQDIYYPLQMDIFEGSRFHLPKAPLACLDISYTNWRNKIVVYPWCHKKEEYTSYIIEVDISVDNRGLIKN